MAHTAYVKLADKENYMKVGMKEIFNKPANQKNIQDYITKCLSEQSTINWKKDGEYYYNTIFYSKDIVSILSDF